MTYVYFDEPKRPKGSDHVDESAPRCPSMYDAPSFGWSCTRIDGHAGDHEAGISSGPNSVIVATWNDTDRGAR